jgi:hypothetical protein
MRFGKVEFMIGYIVDLDNKDMVELAKDYIVEDINVCVKYNDTYNYIDMVEDSSLTEDDIPQCIVDHIKELEGDN